MFNEGVERGHPALTFGFSRILPDDRGAAAPGHGTLNKNSMTPSIDELLSDDRWLRRTAFALTRDTHLAEDLAQDAWVAGLEGRGGGRPWLRGLLRYGSWAERRRAAAERLRAERVASERPSVSVSTEEAAELAEMRGIVAEELLGLSETLREAVYLRFVGGRNLADIARHTGVSTSTASERVKRGVAELRRRMDARCGGDRAAWAAPLAGLAAREVASSGVVGAGAGAAMSSGALAAVPGLVAAAGAAALVAGGAALWGTRNPIEAAPDVRSAELTAPANSGVVGVQPVEEDGRVALTGDGPRRVARRGTMPAPPPAISVSRAGGAEGADEESPLPIERLAPGEPLPDPLPEGSIEVVVREPWLFGALGPPLDPDHVHLVPFSDPTRVLGPIGSEGGRVAFGPLLEDSYRLEIDDPRFDHFVRDDIEAGGKVGVELVGSAALELDVRTADGRRVSELEVGLTYLGISTTAADFEMSPAGDLVDGLFPWSYKLVVRTPEGVAHAMIEPALEPGEQRRMELVAEPLARLSGALVHPDGAPASGVPLRLVHLQDGAKHRPGGEVLELSQFSSHPPARRVKAEGESGPGGEFVFTVDRPGRYVVLAGRRARAWAETDLVEVEAGANLELPALTIPRGGTIRGVVRPSDGRSLEGSLLLWWDGSFRSPWGPGAGPAVLDAHGRFELEGMPAGTGGLWWFRPGDPRMLMGYTAHQPAGGTFVGSARAEEGIPVEVDLELDLER